MAVSPSDVPPPDAGPDTPRDVAPAIPDIPDIVQLLTSAELTARGFMPNASNATLLVRVGEPNSGVHAVYKPARGERPLWDFPDGTLHRREVAAYVVSRFLGWSIVPPTVCREGPFGEGSVQLFVPHDPSLHYFALVDDPHFARPLARIAVFDLLVNNADRKGGHILVDEARGELIGIDHGVTFHALPKLRTVVWDLGRAEVDPMWRADLRRLADELAGRGALRDELAALLAPEEVEALRERAVDLASLRRLPDVPTDRRPYPWPPL